MATDPAKTPAEDLLGVGDFFTTASAAIPAAGLLTAKPELLEAELTAAKWQAELDKYLASERS